MTSYWSYWFHILKKYFFFNIDVIHKCLMCLNWEVLASLGSHVLSNSSTIIIQYFILLLLTYWSTELTYFLYITYKILQAVGTYSWQLLFVNLRIWCIAEFHYSIEGKPWFERSFLLAFQYYVDCIQQLTVCQWMKYDKNILKYVSEQLLIWLD